MSDSHDVCPNCSFVLPDLVPDEPLSACPSCQHQLIVQAEMANDASTDSVAGVSEDERAETVQEWDDRKAELMKLLPPKFLLDDPDFYVHRNGDNVLLPDGKGGITSVKRNVVKVQHKGQTVELVALTPEQRRRRQLIWNCVWIGIGVLFLWFIFSMI